MEKVREQYERYPYPPVPWLALPRRGEGVALAYETGTRLATGSLESHEGKRILVAGSGTLEALVVAQTHPLAREIVAVDLSAKSLELLRLRCQWAKLARGIRGERLAPVRTECADLLNWDGGKFDYILASNLLHHSPAPGLLLERLSSMLSTGGILRVVTYPRASRIWMRRTGEWLKHRGVRTDHSLIRSLAETAIDELPESHPIRSCYASQPETGKSTGLVDAFLNACENPLSPLEWREQAAHAGLALFAEGQDDGSRSDFLEELVPESRLLNRWERLQVLDDLLEICANPVLWFRKLGIAEESQQAEIDHAPTADNPEDINVDCRATPRKWAEKLRDATEAKMRICSRARAELGLSLRRSRALLAQAGIGLDEVFQSLEAKVGPRVDIDGSKLPGLSILEYPREELLALPGAWSHSDWDSLDRWTGRSFRLYREGVEVQGYALAQQARELELLHGHEMSWISVEIRRRGIA